MKEYIKTILVEHINQRPEYLTELFKQLYRETAVEFKDKLNSKEAAYYLNISKDINNVCRNREYHIISMVRIENLHLQTYSNTRKKKSIIVLFIKHST